MDLSKCALAGLVRAGRERNLEPRARKVGDDDQVIEAFLPVRRGCLFALPRQVTTAVGHVRFGGTRGV